MQTYGKGKARRGEYTGMTDIDGLIIIDGDAESVGRYAFAHSNVRKVVIDAPIVEKGAFYNCKYLEEVVFSDNVIKIEEEAFYKCTALTRANISRNLVMIGKSAFAGCTSLEKLVLYDKLRESGECAFTSCDSLVSLKVSESLHRIANYAFSNCLNLYEVDFSGGNLILDGQEHLDDAVLLENVKSFINIGDHPFLGCSKVKFFNAKAYRYDVDKKIYKRTLNAIMETWMKVDEKSISSKIAGRVLKSK